MAPFLDVDYVTECGTTPASKHTRMDGSTPPDSVQGELDDIAVVGMACRVAGDNDTPEKLWQSLLNKQVASSEMPAMRWEPYYRRDSRNAKVLNNTTQRGYFVKDVENFDSTFFGISPKEAVLMDPQQRITVEVTWEALEDAGIPPSSLAGSNTAVFMGVNSDDYGKLLLEDIPGVEAWMGIGTAYCGIPNRISYLLDLRGPSTALDAACASSLVAVHHGRQSLLTGETDVAIVGGVNVLAGPGLTRVLDIAGATSKDGVCRSFDNDANGYGRGEGASVIILKRMSDAIHDNDRILALVKGSAVGQDGRTNGIMAPNGDAQESVARTALGGIDPSTIQYVEAHATSTSVGDPVEIKAMSKVYGANRKATSPCYIGSIKPNIGHLEAGAGAMGFMKAVMAVRNGVIPPQANLKSLNQKIDWTTCGIKVPFESTQWPDTRTTRRAAICSYGYGGTVSHAVIEAAPMGDNSPAEMDNGDHAPTVLLLSAPQEKRLPADAVTLGTWMAGDGKGTSLSSIASTMATRRAQHDCRAAFIIDSHAKAAELSEKLATGGNSADIITGRILGKNENTGAVWLFSGHGAQWLAMGKELLANEPLLLETVEFLEPIIQEEAGFSALEALTHEDFKSSDKVQILTFVMQVGLATILASKGARPSAVVGHSLGEIAAAVVAGALTIAEGALVVCRRAVLYRQVMGQGAMVLVNMPFAQMTETLGDRSDITASIESSPSSCVVSGTIGAIKEFSTKWEDAGHKVLKVNSDVAFHSPLLNVLTKPLYASLCGVLNPKVPTVPLYTTTLEDAREQAPRDAHYWVQNMLKPVLLNAAMKVAAEDGYRIFLEVSTHPVISHSVTETLMDMGIEDHAVIPTLLRNKPAQRAILKSLATMWCRGVAVDWNMLFPGVNWADNVPKTKWRHQAFWKNIGTGPANSAITHDVDTHTLLGQQIPVAGESTTLFTTKLDDNTKPFPGSHPLHGTEIIPAAVLFNTFFHATGAKSLNNVNLRVPVAISAPRDIQVVAQGGEVRLMSRLIEASEDTQVKRNASWLTHTTANAVTQSYSDSPNCGVDIDLASIQARLNVELKPSFSIDYLAGVGVPAMGFPWAVTKHVGNNKEMLARVDVSPATAANASLPWSATSWAPVFDAATSIGSTLFYETPRLRMPAQVASTVVYEGAAPPKIAYIYVQDASTSKTSLAVDVTITNEAGKALAKFISMRFSEIEGTPGAKDNADGLVHQLAWPPARLSETPSLLKHVVLVSSENNPLMRDYTTQLAQRHVKTSCIGSAEGLSSALLQGGSEGTIIMYLPEQVESMDAVSAMANTYCKNLLDVVKYVAASGADLRVFAVTLGALTGSATPTALAHSPLVGLGRIIAAEQPALWGALIDVDSTAFPVQAVKYISGADVIKMEDTIAKVNRLRPMPQDRLYPLDKQNQLHPRAEGTYIISGGLGSLGREVADFLVERGARRIVLLSRRALPPRIEWASQTGELLESVQKIQLLEQAGATVFSVAIDLGAPDAAASLLAKLDMLSLPPVLGVVHAAGVLEDQLVLSATEDSFNRVLAPKVTGALALHKAFPPTTVDFFMLFSSCGQLFGFPGQASYASGNAFLDSLADHRRGLGDNAVALQWTSWRGMGMASSTDFIEAELESKGITSITRDEAFRAWDHVAKYDMSHGVVLRSRVLEPNEPLPMDILEEIAIRRSSAPSEGGANNNAEAGTSVSSSSSKETIPPAGPERNAYLTTKISECVASVLDLPDVGDVDPKVALPELGMDSVMTVALRRQLQTSLGVKVPPTLVWGHPTVSHLVKWFADKVGA
ncbi:6-methylsalicylic acid synthase [Endocarpon pusillum Z07020]|uniref:6-methylsalicylic acid synthase n=1 Tax=Endocarpon pusillum (strain Z07020 / HMAS-L-300199) TaxID=1263415 RepID=U1I185_ENDPU|nr:6-methylsalicylic acid synthase [Endocarpon pusillum Z07020]ERF77015.1 6-methylsalicylic acid synthase [Endocarpon pusillum Z07020]